MNIPGNKIKFEEQEKENFFEVICQSDQSNETHDTITKQNDDFFEEDFIDSLNPKYLEECEMQSNDIMSFSESEFGELSTLIDEMIENEEKIALNARLSARNFYDKMIRLSKKHSKGFKFNIGDEVFISKDFDTNENTKNPGLETSYIPIIYKVIANDGFGVKIRGPSGEVSVVS